jgi:polar amino acid transport system substrate-binding protein
MQFFTGAAPVSVFAEAVTSNNRQVVDHDSVFITLRFSDGSNGCVAYVAEGDKTLPKERIEIFGDRKSVVIDDFRRASFYSKGVEEQVKLRTQDKGQADEVRAVCAVVKEGLPSPINLDELVATTRATFRVLDSLRTGQPQRVE